MVDSVMFWNEPNNKSHWDFEVDPDWSLFAQMVNLASDAVAAENPRLTKVLGGISPIDPAFVNNLKRKDVLEHMDAVAVHGFPLDWNHWQLNEWPEKLREIQAVARRERVGQASSLTVEGTSSSRFSNGETPLEPAGKMPALQLPVWVSEVGIST